MAFFVKDLYSEEEGTLEVTYTSEHKVEIDKSVSKDELVILHEMIHVYEAILEEIVDQHYHDIITIALYNDLSKKIPDLENRIVAHSHTITNNEVMLIGGRHGILFFLKSLDLDIRLNLKLGSIMGYGRDNNQLTH